MTYFPMPAELRRELPHKLPGDARVTITPRDDAEKRCSAWQATHYEVAAYYVAMETDLLPLYQALHAMPEVYLLTYAGLGRLPEPEWPVRYRDANAEFRPMVRALWRPVA